MRSSYGYSSPSSSSNTYSSGRASGLTNSLLNSATTSGRGSYGASTSYGAGGYTSSSGGYGGASSSYGLTSSPSHSSVGAVGASSGGTSGYSRDRSPSISQTANAGLIDRSPSTSEFSRAGGARKTSQDGLLSDFSLSRNGSTRRVSGDRDDLTAGYSTRFGSLLEDEEAPKSSFASRRYGTTSSDDQPGRGSGGSGSRGGTARAKRDTKDSEADNLLERYGIRKSSVVDERPASAAAQRKPSLYEAGTSRDVLGSTLGLGTGRYERERADPIAKLFAANKRELAQPPPEPKDEQEYVQRLLAAHSRVDELLKGRGFNADDERKYLKSWEAMPIVREIRQDRRLRRMSTSSSDDSGLSADAEPEAHTALSDRLIRLDDEVYLVETMREVKRERATFSCKAPELPLVEVTMSSAFSGKPKKGRTDGRHKIKSHKSASASASFESSTLLAERKRKKEEEEGAKREAAEKKAKEEAERKAREKEILDRKREEEQRKREAEEVKKADEQRKRAEDERRKAEEQRKRAEDERKKAEEQRKRAEVETKKAEEQRKKAEEQMKRAEDERKKDEEQRKRAEEQRKRAEDERKKAEKQRKKPEEEERGKAEEDRKKKEELKQKAEIERKAKEDQKIADEEKKADRERTKSATEKKIPKAFESSKNESKNEKLPTSPKTDKKAEVPSVDREKAPPKRSATMTVTQTPAEREPTNIPKRMLTADLASLHLRKVDDPKKKLEVAKVKVVLRPTSEGLKVHFASPKELSENNVTTSVGLLRNASSAVSDSAESSEEENDPWMATNQRLKRAAAKLNNPPVISQRDILAKLKRRNKYDAVRSTAEISIQHCSFFQVQEKLKIPEKNVRINLRLTERAPSTGVAKVVLRAPPRLGFARADIRIEPRPPELRRTQTQAIGAPREKKPAGKLRSMTVSVGVDYVPQLRPIRKLQIPLLFTSDNPLKAEIADARDKLKKVNFVEVTTRSHKRQRSEPVKRKIAQRPETAPIVQKIVEAEERKIALTSPPSTASKKASIRVAPPPVRCGVQIISASSTSSSGNSEHTSVRHATSGVWAAPREANEISNNPSNREPPVIATAHRVELTETDRRLIEQFRAAQNIPKPKPILRHLLSPCRPYKEHDAEDFDPPPAPEVLFVKRKTPPPKPVSLLKTVDVKELHVKPVRVLRIPTRPQVKKTNRADFGVILHKPEPINRPPPKICTEKKPWVPKWRRVEIEEPEPKRSEEEEYEEEQEQEEMGEQQEETPAEVVAEAVPKSAPAPKFEEEPKSMSEAEIAMQAARRRHEEEEAAKLVDYEEKRRLEKAQNEEELRALKEKTARRRAEREQEEIEFAERLRANEEANRRAEEERKASQETQHRRRDDRRRQHMMTGGVFAGLQQLANGAHGGRNFVLPPKTERESTLGAVGKKETQSPEQREEAKRPQRTVIKQLHARTCKLEADKYDLEKRHERQEYDLKELSERQKQHQRHKALRMGIDPLEDGDLTHPPRIHVASKFDRQTDRRSFGDRRHMFEAPIVKRQPKIAHGTARPPAEWGKKNNEELEGLQKHVAGAARSRYVEQCKIESGPPIEPVPLQLPEEEDEEEECKAESKPLQSEEYEEEGETRA